jgi:hypothetical protein
MTNISGDQKKFLNFLKKKNNFKLTDKESIKLLNDFERFVNVIQRIYTQPQAQFHIEEKTLRSGEKIKIRMIESDLDELRKVYDKDKKTQNTLEIFRKFYKQVTEDKYGR